MATTTTDHIPSHKYAECVNLRPMESLVADIVLYQAVTAHSTAGEITNVTTADTGRLLGFAQDFVDHDDCVSGHVITVAVQQHGITPFIAGADCSSGYGDWAVLEGSDGRLKVCPAAANEKYVTHGIIMDDPDADGNYGHIWLNLNVPYFTTSS